MRVLFLTSYPIEAPSTRYRATQYFRFLERDGFSCELWPFMPSGFYNQFYRKGSATYKSIRILAFSIRRLLELFRIGRFDIVVVQREAMLIGPPIVEWIVARVWQKPLVFDFDDSIFVHPETSLHKGWSNALKMPSKTKFLIKSSDHVVVCNDYLREYAFTGNPNTTIIPTVVDAENYSPAPEKTNSS